MKCMHERKDMSRSKIICFQLQEVEQVCFERACGNKSSENIYKLRHRRLIPGHIGSRRKFEMIVNINVFILNLYQVEISTSGVTTKNFRSFGHIVYDLCHFKVYTTKSIIVLSLSGALSVLYALSMNFKVSSRTPLSKDVRAGFPLFFLSLLKCHKIKYCY